MEKEIENMLETAFKNACAQSCIAETSGGASFAVVPKGYEIKDLEIFDAVPRRISASPRFGSLESFLQYLKDFKTPTTRIFADTKTGVLTASIDYHGAETPSWRSHSAKYEPQLSEEWTRWKAKDNQYMSQADFAEFIESNVDDIRKPENPVGNKLPTGTDMLEIAKSFEAKTSTEFKSGVRLDNGAQKLTFSQETTARAGASNEIEIPEVFELALIPFAFGEAYPVRARLRYRVNDKKELLLKYQLINPHKVIEAVVLSVLTEVGSATEIIPLIGAA